MGAANSREFAKEGVIVNALDRKGDVERICEEIRRNGGPASAYMPDITDQEAYRGYVERVASQSGRIDTLVNNAAVCPSGDILTDTLEQWREVQKGNLEAVYWSCKLAAPHIAAAPRQHHHDCFGTGHGHRWRGRFLCCGEGRAGQLHQIACSRTRATRSARQRDRSRFHSHAHVFLEWSG
ncbi:MAG: hypothetical protein DMG57_40165 [Acidobacteria bacterium]|nr:MAG: hypothetical protein DMG57_40165 [Acidobacteriota bacterium]